MQTSHLSKLYRSSLGLLTDLYQLTMAYGYWKANMQEREAVFHLFYRKNPFQGDYAVNAGLALAIDYLKEFAFSPADLAYLSSLNGSNGEPLFEEEFLSYLGDMSFSCDIDAVPEGTIVFPHQPLVRVKGPIIQAQLIETALLNILNFSTLIATKAARIVQAAEGDSVLEFGLRRAQGIDGGLTASRSAFIGGCIGTSNVLAGQLFGIPVKGTHAHSWVMGFEDELDAFETYAKAMPHNCILLVDTYDTVEGVHKAIEVGLALKNRGYEMIGIRLDSGDLKALSIASRRLLDEAGLTQAKIVASNDLDEYKIAALKRAGAPIDIWGVGTRLVTASDQSALGGVYKLAAIQDEEGKWQYKIKQSEDAIKVSNPGLLQVVRAIDEDGFPIGDCMIDEWLENSGSEMICLSNQEEIILTTHNSQKLLVPIFRNGNLVYNLPTLDAIRTHSLAQQSLFAMIDLPKYPQGLELNLYQIKRQLLKDINLRTNGMVSSPN